MLKLSHPFSLYCYLVYVGLRTSRNSRRKRPKQCRLFRSFATEILSCVFLEGCHTSRFDHVDDCCSIQYNAIHSHIIGCGFLFEFFKVIQEVWLWSRHQVTIFGNRSRITTILVWKELIEVAISNLTSDVKSQELLPPSCLILCSV